MSVRAGRHASGWAEDVSVRVAPGPSSDPAVVDLTVSLRPSFRGGTASPLVKLVAQLLLRVYVFLLLPAPSQEAIVTWSPAALTLAGLSERVPTEPHNAQAALPPSFVTDGGRVIDAPQTPHGERGGGSEHGSRSRRERATAQESEPSRDALSRDNLGRERRSFLENTPFSGRGWSREIEYQDQARQRIETDARGKRTTFLLDGLGRVIRETDHAGKFALSTWDGVNKREQTDKRPAHHVTTFRYDALNRPTLVKDPLPFGYELRTQYVDAQNQVEETDRRGTVKRTQLDALGRVRSITDAVGLPEQAVLERNTYDGVGNKTLAIDAENRQTSFAYDGANRLRTRIDGFSSPEAAMTSYDYDLAGNREIEQDQRARDNNHPFSIKRLYDPLNRVRDEYDGEGNHSVFGYDDEGNRTLVQEPKGQRTTLAYDERGALLAVTQPPTDAGTPVTRHGYDENRNRMSQTDARGHVVAMEYDDLDRLEWMIQPGNIRTHHEYDENGNLLRVTDPNGNLTVNTYDELNRLRVKTYTPAAGLEVPWRRGVRIEYVLDENGNPTSTYDDYRSGTDPPVRLTTTRAYDRLDRLTSETSQTAYGQSVTVGTTYFRNGLRRTVTDAASAVTEYEYDGQNRLKIARSNAGTPDARATSYVYWPDGLVREVQSPNGVKAGHLYDRADRLRNLTNTRGATVISSYSYGYDRNGNREMQVEVNGGLTETTTYGYDSLNRLERITYPIDSSHPTGRTVTYDYDLVGNRTGEKEVDGGNVVRSDKTAAFDPLNRLTSVDDTVDNANDATFTYDDNGNQRTKATGGVTSTYVYDDRNQLAEVRTSTAGPTPVARFQYDASGRRILKIGSPTDPSDSGTRQFVYDQTAVLQELDSTGLAQARYEWGGDRLLSLNRRMGPTLERRFYSFDALGSVTNLTDDAGVARASYHLDTWGNYRFPAELTPAGDLSGAGRNRFGFTGYLWDQETELYFAKARFYDPEFGRFTSQDSFLGEINDPPSLHRYFYANDRPTFFVDPTGHAAEDPWYQRINLVALGAFDAASTNFNPFHQQLESSDVDVQAGQIVGHLLSIPAAAYEMASGFTIAGGGAAGGAVLAVPSGGTALAPAAGMVVAGGAMMVHGGIAGGKAVTNLASKVKDYSGGSSIGGDGKPQVVKEPLKSADGTKTEPLITSDKTTKGNAEPASGVYEIRGELSGKKKKYVGSGRDMDVRLSDGRHPARQLMDEGENVTTTQRSVDVSDAPTTREAGRILRTNEQVSMDEVARESGESLNKIRARDPKKFERDLPKYGDRRQEPRVQANPPKKTEKQQ